MRIITRYIVVELLKTTAIAAISITLLMLGVGIVREALNQKLPLDCLLRLVPYVLPDALRVALPVTLLLAATAVYGRLAGSNEVMAVKAAGVSPAVLLSPAIVLSVAFSLLTVWLNDVAVSWGRWGICRVVLEAAEQIAYNMLKLQHQYTHGRLSIHVRRVDGRKLISPTITVRLSGDKPPMTISAEVAELKSDLEHGILRVRLRNGTVEVGDKLKLRFADQYEQEWQVGNPHERFSSDHPSWLPLRVIRAELRHQREELAELEADTAVEFVRTLLMGPWEELGAKKWSERKELLEYKRGLIQRLQTEPYRRWAAGFSCFCFVLVGGAMAMRLRSREILTSFFLCFVPILVLYYPFLALGVDGAKSGMLPPWCVWGGNLIFAGWGTWLLRREVNT